MSKPARIALLLAATLLLTGCQTKPATVYINPHDTSAPAEPPKPPSVFAQLVVMVWSIIGAAPPPNNHGSHL
jgi:PBP1b-binding outer membrane lipoprotein LpoB